MIRGDPPAWGSGEALTNPAREKQNIKKYSQARWFLWRQKNPDVKLGRDIEGGT